MKSGTLHKYKDQEYYDKHPVMYLLTPDITYKMDLIAGYITPSDSELYSLPKAPESRSDFLQYALQKLLSAVNQIL